MNSESYPRPDQDDYSQLFWLLAQICVAATLSQEPPPPDQPPMTTNLLNSPKPKRPILSGQIVTDWAEKKYVEGLRPQRS